MKRFLFIAMALFACGSLSVHAQTATDVNEGVRVAADATTGTQLLTWWGKAGRTYFVQQSFDLLTWNFVPTVESGTETVCGLNLASSDPRQFWRLVYTDTPTGGNALTADYDGDGVSNYDEVSPAFGTNPFLRDSDWDGYTDQEEFTAGTSPTAGASNPATYQPTPGPLNPDSSYRNGLRLAYSGKYMQAYHQSSTASSPTSHSGWGWAEHRSAGPSVFFHPYETSTTQDLTPQVQADYVTTPFLTADRYFFQTPGPETLESWEQKATSEFISSSFLLRTRYEVQAQPSPAAAADAQRTLVAFLYEGGTSLSQLKETGTITFSRQNVACSASMQQHCQITGNKVIIEPKLAANPPNINSTPGWTVTSQDYYLQLWDVAIAPDANMAGVLGDMVKSTQPGSRVRHFVTPKKSAELPQPYVEFTAPEADASLFTDLFDWEGGEAGSASNKRKVKRDDTGVTTLKIKTKKDGVVVDEIRVWVVWCEPPTVTNGTASFDQVVEPLIVGGVHVADVNKGAVWSSTTNWKFKFVIKPLSICDPNILERPDLTGPKQNPAPGAGNDYSFNPSIKADSATLKWDVSRQIKVSVRNPNKIVKAALQNSFPAAFCVNQPTTDDSPVIFPTDPVEGNDDPLLSPMDEDANPYQAVTSGDLQHGIGELTSIDAPKFGAEKDWGATGYHWGAEDNFREFCRLEITDGTRSTGTFWFRISDYFDWHFYFSTDFDDTPHEWRDAPPPSQSETNTAHPIP
jgi:hypothetical protein